MINSKTSNLADNRGNVGPAKPEIGKLSIRKLSQLVHAHSPAPPAANGLGESFQHLSPVDLSKTVIFRFS